MLDNIRFFLRHSLNDLWINGQRTFFSLLCIAAGVAAIVSLQTLAVMIGGSLTGGLQESNRGDIQFQLDAGFSADASDEVLAQAIADGLIVEQTVSFFGQRQTTYLLSQGGIDAISAWLDESYPGAAELTYRQPLADPISLFLGSGDGTALVLPATGADASQVVPLLIDPDVYPFYGEVVATTGEPLSALINAPTDIVISDQVAQVLGAETGDTLQISGADAEFTVRGVVDTGQEIKNPASDMLISLFGFYYLDQSAIELFEDVPAQADLAFIKLSDPSAVVDIDSALQAEFPFVQTTTTEDLRENYTLLSDNINTLVTVMGLLSMLIGSIGIVNTMQVIVRRRTVEVAVLKTLGLQANEITTLFLVQAMLMGVIGSVAGVVLGWGATFLIRGVAERLLATDLPFVLTPQPAVTGILIGVIITTVFGFLPTLTAGQVRPGIVLRPTDVVIPRTGRVQTLLVLGLVIMVLSLIAQGITGTFSSALQLIVGVFVAAGVLYLIVSLLIWLVGRFFPAFGLIDLKISLRQMLAARGRASMTLLALVVGVFSLSTITLLADSINNLLEFSLQEASGGNVTISAASPAQLPAIERVLDDLPYVEQYRVQRGYTMRLLSIQQGDIVLSPGDLRARLEAMPDFFGFGGEGAEADAYEVFAASISSVSASDVSSVAERSMVTGRQLAPSDSGARVIVLTTSPLLEAAGLRVGDLLTYDLGSDAEGEAPALTFELIGIAQSSFGGFEAQNYVPIDAFPADIPPTSNTITAQVDKEQIASLRQQLATVPGSFVLDNAVLTRLVSGLLGTFTAFPTMVAALGLIVGGVVIANSVALTTMERRREIAVMKSVGLQRERVLFMILLENGVLGLIGGLIGVGIGLLALILLIGTTGAPSTAIPVGSAMLLMLLCVVVALIAALTSAWGASGEKPLNVLRYE
ncbi:MAG: FtsX-like permease family protein [Chloroflexi bacterium]|nr:FtsX-like permease family protein [Chloroflexota bacterium]